MSLQLDTPHGVGVDVSADDVKKAFKEVRAQFAAQSEKQLSTRAASAGRWLDSLLNKSGGATEGTALHL